MKCKKCNTYNDYTRKRIFIEGEYQNIRICNICGTDMSDKNFKKPKYDSNTLKEIAKKLPGYKDYEYRMKNKFKQ